MDIGTIPPVGCRYCGRSETGHGRAYCTFAGWHEYTPHHKGRPAVAAPVTEEPTFPVVDTGLSPAPQPPSRAPRWWGRWRLKGIPPQ